MIYNILNDLLPLLKMYESEFSNKVDNLASFLSWVKKRNAVEMPTEADPEWSGKDNGRSADSVINTSLVHLYRYARAHAKQAIAGSGFSTPDEFVYLLNLSVAGSQSKGRLIKENVHEKPAGTLVIKRLLNKGYISQQTSTGDKRSSLIDVTATGSKEMKNVMKSIRSDSKNVTEPLDSKEKLELITLLQKLENHHYRLSLEKNKSGE